MKIEPGFYVHFKGKLYSVVVIAKHADSSEELVIYRAMYDSGSYWARPLSSFLEEVEVDGKKVPRFRKATLDESDQYILKMISPDMEVINEQ